jgi:hypothetical protein
MESGFIPESDFDHVTMRMKLSREDMSIPAIETSALRADDILLSYGDRTIVVDVLRLIDGGHYCHGQASGR